MNWLGVVATILAPGGLLAILIERTRRENNRDHARNSDVLNKIDQKIDKIDERMDHHIEWHLGKDK
jgi:hypothetical protein